MAMTCNGLSGDCLVLHLRRLALLLIYLCTLLPGPAAAAGLTIYAAASLTNALHDAAALWAHSGNPSPTIRFAASASLAADIAAGAHVDVFASTDPAATPALIKRGFIAADSVRTL